MVPVVFLSIFLSYQFVSSIHNFQDNFATRKLEKYNHVFHVYRKKRANDKRIRTLPP